MRMCVLSLTMLHISQTLDYALAVESVTSAKKDTLILNVDGCIAVSFVDLLRSSGAFNSEEAEEYMKIGTLNALFVLGRSIGFVGHHLDQKRLRAPLYRHDAVSLSPSCPRPYLIAHRNRMTFTSPHSSHNVWSSKARRSKCSIGFIWAVAVFLFILITTDIKRHQKGGAKEGCQVVQYRLYQLEQIPFDWSSSVLY